MKGEIPKPELQLRIHEATRFVLLNPHYPENVGAAARAIKTMGFLELCLVKPSRIAMPDHEMARKMAVKSWDVLEAARLVKTLDESLEGIDYVVMTSSRRGISGVVQPRELAADLVERAEQGSRIAIVFGNEKTGLDSAELARADVCVRIPMAADQPSVNLAQATQVIAYELLLAALARREALAARVYDVDG